MRERAADGGRPGARVDVVVPAHDEEALIAASLSALLASREHLRASRPAVSVSLTVALDACSDGTEAIVRRFEPAITVVSLDARNVGAARRAGTTAALARAAEWPPERRWLAHTDADSRVPVDWLAVHADALDRGTQLLLGTIRPDFDDLSPDDRLRWLTSHPPGHLPGNVHGAHLGIRADVYSRLGGFAALAEHEDVDLVSRARALGEVAVEATLDAPVVTSGRRVGRTPGGYAGFLAATYGPAPTSR